MGEDLLFIARRPTQQCEEVEHSLRQIAEFLVVHDTDGAMPLRELAAILAEDHRQVGIYRVGYAQRLLQLQVYLRVG